MLGIRFRLPMMWCLLAVACACALVAPAAIAGLECKIDRTDLGCGSARLCASTTSDELDYQWTGPAGFRSEKPCVDVKDEGRYQLKISSKKSRESSECAIDVRFEKTPPCEISGDRSICAGETTDLCGPLGDFEYAWSNGSTQRCITVSEPGTYTLEVSGGGCKQTCAATVALSTGPECEGEPGTPTCAIVGRSLSCGPSRLCADDISTSFAYRWVGPAGFLAETPCIDAAVDGQYILTVTSPGTQEAVSCSIDVKILRVPPCGIEGKTRICRGESATLCGPDVPLLTYEWTGPGGQPLSTERCLTVSDAGTYSLTVSDGACPVTCTATVEFASGAECGEDPGRCWLTGGGSQAVDGRNGRGKKDMSWGGNVNPGCSPTAGDGGNWNHVDRILNLHFQGRAITVLRCGNVVGIPPGSTSPRTPVNFIEFEGVGRLMGHAGKKVNEDVHFWAHYEDRAEPGSHGQSSRDARDRYFLHVFTDPDNRDATTRLLVDVDGDPSTMDPITVDHGNLQIHISGCDKRGGATESFATPVTPVAARVVLAPPRPNPASRSTMLRFALPRDAGVVLAVHDVTGRLVRELASGQYPAGEHQVAWDFADGEGRRVRGGVFFVRLVSGGQVYQQSVTVLP